jgi:hypothetical protein
MRPPSVREASQLASVRLALMKAQATRQQQLIVSQRSTLAAAIGESRERANVFESRNEDIPILWRVQQSARDKANLRFLAELKARDEIILADPYALVRRPVFDAPPAVPANVSGLDVAIMAMDRLGGDRSLDHGETLEFLFGVAGQVEIPKQTAPATQSPATTPTPQPASQ